MSLSDTRTSNDFHTDMVRVRLNFWTQNETHTLTLLHTIKSVSDCWPLILCDGFAVSYLVMSWEVHGALLAATSCTGAGGGILSAGPEMLIKLLCNYPKRRSL